jgi:hypothetical protein
LKQHPTTSLILLALAAAGVLTACGGGSGGSPQSPATITVTADNGTVAWNAPVSFDVLGNDAASRGALTLTAVTGALHGTATVANGKVSYTPDAGFYGTETLSYTASAVEGGATAKGDLRLAVEAVLTLNGIASDNPLPNAAVSAAVGAKNFTATADASGNFSVVVSSTAPLDFVTLTAVGSGVQEKVKLVSLVGDIDGLAKAAGPQGQVSMTAVPKLAVSHYSTAFTALAIKARNGTPPGTALQLRDVALQFSLDDLLQRATAIRLVADNGVPLPAGISDTFALAQNQAAVDAVHIAARTPVPGLPAATRASVENEIDAGSAFTLGGLAERTVAYPGRNFSVTYRADGTGRLSGSMGENNITWVAEGATVRLSYEKPVEWLYPPHAIKVNGAWSQYTIREHASGMIIRLVLGESAAKWAESGTVTWVDGPDAGKPVVVNVTTANSPKYITTVMYLDRRLPIDAAMTAPGSRLFGLPYLKKPVFGTIEDSGFQRVEMPGTATDVLEFTSATDARFVINEEAVTWKVLDNWLYLTYANGNVWRLGLATQSDTTTKQLWLAEFDALKIKKGFPGYTTPASSMRFTPELAMRQWNYSFGSGLIGKPQADGTAPSDEYSGSDSTWEITAAGDLIIKHSQGGELQHMSRYIPIKMVGEQLWFLAHNVDPGSTSTLVGYIEKRP